MGFQDVSFTLEWDRRPGISPDAHMAAYAWLTASKAIGALRESSSPLAGSIRAQFTLFQKKCMGLLGMSGFGVPIFRVMGNTDDAILVPAYVGECSIDGTEHPCFGLSRRTKTTYGYRWVTYVSIWHEGEWRPLVGSGDQVAIVVARYPQEADAAGITFGVILQQLVQDGRRMA